AFICMTSKLLISSEELEKLPYILDKLFETVFMSIAASTTGAIVAMFLAVMRSNATSPNTVFRSIERIIASSSRNIPIVGWALILLLSFGQNSLTGYLALFIGSVEFLTRAFIESIDEIDHKSMEALRATGAT